MTAGAAFAQPAQSNDAVDGLNTAVETMVQHVAPSVVQVLVSKLDAQTRSDRTDVVDWERSVGSGVIVSPDGYIVTNAHVVAQAQQISVRVIPVDRQERLLRRRPQNLAAQRQSGDSIALLVERAGRWSYLAFDMP